MFPAAWGTADSRRRQASSRGMAESNSRLYGCRGPAKNSRPLVSTSLPERITATRSATSATMPKSCVISHKAMPVSLRKRLNNSRTWACRLTSSAVVGSSAISKSGSPANAMAIMAR